MLKPDPSTIRKTLELFSLTPGQVSEIRAIDVKRNGSRPATYNGYFKMPGQLDQAIKEIQRLDNTGQPTAIWCIPNPLEPALLAVRNGKIGYAGSGEGAQDKHVLVRSVLLLDVDAVRPVTSVQATDAEHNTALDELDRLRDTVREHLGVDVVLADSGNGGHALLRLPDLPNDVETSGLLKNLLSSLKKLSGVNLDESTSNPARACKLYGTVSRKGEDLDERPHRITRLLEVPDGWRDRPASLDKLRAVAALAETSPRPTVTRATPAGQALDVPDWCSRVGLAIERVDQDERSTKYFVTCPWCGNGNAAIMQQPDGVLSYKCYHATHGCHDRTWHDLRKHYQPDAPRHTAQSDPAPNEYYMTDLGNSKRLTDQYNQKLCYCHAWRSWLHYKNGRWHNNAEMVVAELAKQAMLNILHEAATVANDKERQALVHHAMASQSNRAISAMLSLSRSDPRISTDPDEFDAHDDLFNVSNGTLDLRTGELRPHRPGDLLSKQSPVAYDPAATCPNFLKFLDRVMAGNAELIRFLQRAAGYSMTGYADERCLFILHGCGSNGKSTLTDILAAIFGDYSRSTPSETLLAKRYDGGVPNDLAGLAGSRLVLTQETDRNRDLAEARVKALTGGGEKMAARFLFGEFFEFRPKFKIWLGTNHRPKIRGDDLAIWSRIRLVPFDVVIPPAEQIPRRELVGKILDEEASGVLNWCLTGAAEWYAHGLGTPAEVLAATAEYQYDQDTSKLSQFLSECTVSGVTGSILHSSLYEKYEKFCKDPDNDAHPVTLRDFSRRLTERGLKSRKTNAGKVWLGLQLVGYRDLLSAENAGDDQKVTQVTQVTDIYISPREVNAGYNLTKNASPSSLASLSAQTATDGVPLDELPEDLKAAINGVFDENNDE